MNRIIRTTVAILLPFAAGAIALSAAGASAYAGSPQGPNGPIIINPTPQPPKPPKAGPTDLAPAPQQPTVGPTDLAPVPQQPKDDPTDWAPAPVDGDDDPMDWAPAPTPADQPVDTPANEPAAPSNTTGPSPLPGTTAPTTINDVVTGTEPIANRDRVESDAQLDRADDAGLPVALYAALVAGLLGLAALVIILAARRRRV